MMLTQVLEDWYATRQALIAEGLLLPVQLAADLEHYGRGAATRHHLQDISIVTDKWIHRWL